VDVVLTPAGGGAPITVTTDVNGDYSSGVPAGDVDADVVDPVGAILTTANDPQTVAVPAGGTGTATDVGYSRQPPAQSMAMCLATPTATAFRIRASPIWPALTWC
jgi:hypothetical protein